MVLADDGVKWRIWYHPYLTSDSVTRMLVVGMQWDGYQVESLYNVLISFQVYGTL
jgi:hypothetical protein